MPSSSVSEVASTDPDVGEQIAVTFGFLRIQTPDIDDANFGQSGQSGARSSRFPMASVSRTPVSIRRESTVPVFRRSKKSLAARGVEPVRTQSQNCGLPPEMPTAICRAPCPAQSPVLPPSTPCAVLRRASPDGFPSRRRSADRALSLRQSHRPATDLHRKNPTFRQTTFSGSSLLFDQRPRTPPTLSGVVSNNTGA